VHTLEIDHGSTSLTRYGCPQTIAPLRVTAKDNKLCDRTNTTTSGYQWSMSVAGLNDGGFVITWQSPNLAGSRQVNGQIFDTSGNKVGSELTFSDVGDGPSAQCVRDVVRCSIFL
jgi:hypothetical protein